MAIPVLKGKTLLLGITGSIAAYKALDLIRRLKEEGVDVHVVMTKSACQFITPLTVQTLSENAVAIDLFSLREEADIGHIKLARMADLVVIAPATANILAKAASGIADDYLSTILLATRAPVVMCPAMNPAMYENPATQKNIEILKGRNILVVEPDSGSMACGEEGRGRFPPIDLIIEAISKKLTPPTWKDLKVLVSAGPTREFFDPVRFISNPSSGKMGYAIARAAIRRSAMVHLLTGPVSIPPPYGVTIHNVTSAMEMYNRAMELAPEMDIIIMAAAVGDYRPEKISTKKVKKTEKALAITLIPNPDIIAAIGKIKKPQQITVGFAAETDNILENASQKLIHKNLDLIVANDVTRPDSGFCVDTNRVKILLRDGSILELPCLPKEEVAEKLLDVIEDLRRRRDGI
ncbi:MAG: bifunctional phosphopantothenoylcysteine decarboxylase/phosphopantothenate--cysteine ligase CoaBC [Syntrophobacterales bacterium]|nr:bifunctional phosphopantothenoylcysteine decarboxylase/phosphopantothenate--cysteine ligase CoaBC [Syntrophobacterales bacterium]